MLPRTDLSCGGGSPRSCTMPRPPRSWPMRAGRYGWLDSSRQAYPLLFPVVARLRGKRRGWWERDQRSCCTANRRPIGRPLDDGPTGACLRVGTRDATQYLAIDTNFFLAPRVLTSCMEFRQSPVSHG